MSEGGLLDKTDSEEDIEESSDSGVMDFDMSDGEEEKPEKEEKEEEGQEDKSLLSDKSRAEQKALEGKPDWLPKAFWETVEGEDKGKANVENLAKSYTSLRKKMDEGIPSDADAYLNGFDVKSFAKDAGLPEGSEVPSSDPLLKEFAVASKLAGLKPEQFRQVATHVAGKLGRGEVLLHNGPSEIDTEAEMRKLGSNASVIVDAVDGRLKALESRGALTKEEASLARGFGSTAEGIQVLRALLSSGHHEIGSGSPIPARKGQLTKEQFQEVVGTKKWNEDPSYRAEMRRLRAQSRTPEEGNDFSVSLDNDTDPFADT